MKKWHVRSLAISLSLLLPGCGMVPAGSPSTAPSLAAGDAQVVLHFPMSRYPGTGKHIAEAIADGQSAICTIDRSEADRHRGKSLQGIPTKKGYDRDEWPMAFCLEGGEGADIEYVESSDNRGAGSWVSNQLDDYPDGTKVLFVVEDGGDSGIAKTDVDPPSKGNPAAGRFKTCADVRNAGKAPLRKGEPGYSATLDRDGDGIACE